jgi:isopentenyl-diphosphate Delta-isomerase
MLQNPRRTFLVDRAAITEVVLVDENDHPTGTGEKMQVHREGLLHRAFSLFIFNSQGELLLQKRSLQKYHSGGLWSNTCCSHPGPDDILEQIIHTRLQEEMGFDCQLRKIFTFTYQAKLDHGLYEHEIDHVFTGMFDGDPRPDPREVEEWKWVGIEDLLQEIKHSPDLYSFWFREALRKNPACLQHRT